MIHGGKHEAPGPGGTADRHCGVGVYASRWPKLATSIGRVQSRYYLDVTRLSGHDLADHGIGRDTSALELADEYVGAGLGHGNEEPA